MDLQNNNFQDSNTFHNLLSAYSSELQASTIYAIYGIKAKEEGYEQISEIFNNSSRNERVHATLWLKMMNGGQLPTTLENLREAYARENKEWTSQYIGYAEEARREGYNDIADLFEAVAGIERHLDARYRKLAQNISNNMVFCKKNKTLWMCLNCGNLHYGECAPSPCPVCGFSQDYYQLNCENY